MSGIKAMDYRDVWNSLYLEHVDPRKYLYHYTTVNSAIKILYGDTLRFSKISNANDTMESKPWLSGQHDMNLVRKALELFQTINRQYIQILCFTMDSSEDIRMKYGNKLNDDEKRINLAGRGYSLPRMWAQYASDNQGICFIFDQKKIKKMIRDKLSSNCLISGPVDYYSLFKNYSFGQDPLKDLIKKTGETKNQDQKALWNIDFLKRHLDFVKYNYLSKLSDWSGENEYRFVAYGSDVYTINGIKDALIGIVFGEKTEPVYEKVIQDLSPNNCETRKMVFTYQGCQLKICVQE